MPPKRCVALTKSGKRCKIRGNLNPADLCFLHAKRVQQRESVLPEKRERKTSFEQIERGVKIAGPAAGGIWALIQIIQWVVTHWPEIEHFFTTLTGRHYHFQQLKRALESGTVSQYEFVYAVERWYATLPNHVRSETERRFGSVEVAIQSVRRSL